MYKVYPLSRDFSMILRRHQSFVSTWPFGTQYVDHRDSSVQPNRADAESRLREACIHYNIHTCMHTLQYTFSGEP